MTLSILSFCRSLNVFFFSQDRQLHLEDEGDDAVDPHIVDHAAEEDLLQALRLEGLGTRQLQQQLPHPAPWDQI